MEKTLVKIEEYLQKNKGNIVEDLLDLMRVPSVRGEALENMPYGKACDDMINAVARLMEKNGLKTVKRNDLGYTYSLLDMGGEKTIGLYSHGDVVPVDGEWLICPPFEPIIKDGFIFGRGCNDDKSGIVEMLYAAKIIRELSLPFSCNLLLFTGVNEETGMGDVQAFVANEKQPNAGLVLDGGNYPCELGERTVYRFFITNKRKFQTIEDFSGGTAVNIILPEVTVKLSYTEETFAALQTMINGRANFSLSQNGEKIFLSARGEAAPVTYPDNGRNAGLLMTEFLLECDCICEGDKEILRSMRRFLRDNYGEGFGIAHTDSRFGRLTAGNGIISTAEGKIKLSFDVRAGTEFDVERLRAQTTACVEKDWEYEEIRLAKGYIISEDNPYRLALAKGYRIAEGENAPLGGELMSGGTHARHLKNTFPVGNMNRRLIPDYPMPKGHGAYHQPDEKLHVDGFVDAIRILVCLLLGLDEQVNKA